MPNLYIIRKLQELDLDLKQKQEITPEWKYAIFINNSSRLTKESNRGLGKSFHSELAKKAFEINPDNKTWDYKKDGASAEILAYANDLLAREKHEKAANIYFELTTDPHAFGKPEDYIGQAYSALLKLYGAGGELRKQMLNGKSVYSIIEKMAKKYNDDLALHNKKVDDLKAVVVNEANESKEDSIKKVDATAVDVNAATLLETPLFTPKSSHSTKSVTTDTENVTAIAQPLNNLTINASLTPKSSLKIETPKIETPKSLVTIDTSEANSSSSSTMQTHTNFSQPTTPMAKPQPEASKQGTSATPSGSKPSKSPTSTIHEYEASKTAALRAHSLSEFNDSTTSTAQIERETSKPTTPTNQTNSDANKPLTPPVHAELERMKSTSPSTRFTPEASKAVTPKIPEILESDKLEVSNKPITPAIQSDDETSKPATPAAQDNTQTVVESHQPTTLAATSKLESPIKSVSSSSALFDVSDIPKHSAVSSAAPKPTFSRVESLLNALHQITSAHPVGATQAIQAEQKALFQSKDKDTLSIKNLSYNELKYLTNHMNQVQHREVVDTRFDQVRTETNWRKHLGDGKGETPVWREMRTAVKNAILIQAALASKKAEKDLAAQKTLSLDVSAPAVDATANKKINVSAERYKELATLTGQHSGRPYGIFGQAGSTNTAKFFKARFEAEPEQAASNTQTSINSNRM